MCTFNFEKNNYSRNFIHTLIWALICNVNWKLSQKRGFNDLTGVIRYVESEYDIINKTTTYGKYLLLTSKKAFIQPEILVRLD